MKQKKLKNCLNKDLQKILLKETKFRQEKARFQLNKKNISKPLKPSKRVCCKIVIKNKRIMLIESKNSKKKKKLSNTQITKIAEHNNEQGNLLFHQGKYPQTLQQEAVRRNPQNSKYYSNIDQVFIKLMSFRRLKKTIKSPSKRITTSRKPISKKEIIIFT